MAKYHILKHFHTVNKHRFLVFYHCWRCGLPFRGLVHDLSKYSPSEFFPSAKYYQGNRTPIHAERMDHGYYSKVFVHHAKRNKHHYEYWIDYFQKDIVLSPMPYKYNVEYCCDTMSASKTYNGKKFNRTLPLAFFLKVESMCLMHPASKLFVKEFLTRYQESGFKHLHKKETKKLYRECLKKYPKNVLIPIAFDKIQESDR